MGLTCLFGHRWYEGRCNRCGKEYTSYGPLDKLEARICAKNDLVGRSMIINALPQEPLIYLAENADNFSVVDMAIPKIKDENVIAEIALKRNNRDIAYKAVIMCDNPENISKFVNHPDGTVKKFAQEKLEASKLETKEDIEAYLEKIGYSTNQSVANFLKARLSKM